MKTFIVLTLAVLAQVSGDLFLGWGMKAIGAEGVPSDGFSLMMLVQAMQTPTIWMGTALLIVFFACFTTALSWADLSFVLPATAVGYILNVALAYALLHEKVPTARWAGTVLIAVGVGMVAKSGKKDIDDFSGRNAVESLSGGAQS